MTHPASLPIGRLILFPGEDQAYVHRRSHGGGPPAPPSEDRQSERSLTPLLPPAQGCLPLVSRECKILVDALKP